MSDFNPDEYLKQTEDSGGFDPDAYLSAAHPAKPAGPGAGQSFVEHAGNAATLGYLPHLQAGVSQSIKGGGVLDPAMKVDHDLRKQGFNIVEDTGSFVQDRDQNIKRIEQEGRDHPIASMAGTGAGILSSGVALGAAGAGAAGASLGLRALQAAKTGAAMGALANPGDVEGEINPLQFTGRAKNAALGAAIAPLAQVGIEKGAKGAETLAKWLKAKANEKAFRALGLPTQKRMEKLAATGQDQEIGAELLEQGAIPVLGTPGRISDRVGALKEKAGQNYGHMLDEVDAQRIEYTPIKIKNPKRPIQVQEQIDATPVRFDEHPLRKSMPWLRDADAPPVLVRGETQPVQSAMFELPNPQVIAGKPTSMPRYTVDTEKIAKDLANSSDFAGLAKIPGMESTVAKTQTLLDTLAKNGKLTLREAQSLRQSIDESINFTKGTPELKGVQESLFRIRTAIRDTMSDQVDRAAGGLAMPGALKAAGRSYGNLATAEEILEREIARNVNNRSVSLTDTIAGAGGMASGSPALGLALGAANKFGRTFGNSMQARGYDSMSRQLAKLPRFAGIARDNPQAFAQLVSRLSERMDGGSEFARQEEDPIMRDPRIMKQFEANPSLVDSIQNEKLRHQVMKRLNRSPGQMQPGATPGPAPSPAPNHNALPTHVTQPMSEDEAKKRFIQGE